MPPFDGGDDSVGVIDPDEVLGSGIDVGKEAMEIVHKLLDGAEHAVRGEIAEETFHGIEPRGGDRPDVKGQAWLATARTGALDAVGVVNG